MSQPIHNVAVPTLLRVVDNLLAILEKGRLHAEAEKIEPAVLLNARLYPDMFALTRQVQIVSDNVKGCAARLAGIEAPKFADTEASFAELRQRLEKTSQFVRSLDAQQFQNSETHPIVLKFPTRTMNFANGWDYLLTFALPNVYFHAATTYGILRHSGVKLGKGDFLGPIDASSTSAAA